MIELVIAIASGIFGALLFYIIERKTKPQSANKPTQRPNPPTEIDYVQTLEEITNEEKPPPVNTDHLSDADWWKRHSAGKGDDS